MTQATATERAALRSMAREIARRELAPHASALDAEDAATLSECWQRITEVGLGRALLDEAHGGTSLSVDDLLAAIEELAVGDGGVALSVLLSNAALVTLSDERAAVLREGTRWAAVLTERPGLEVTISDGHIDGQIACALGAYGADGIVLVVRGERPAAFALEADTAGLALAGDQAQMGLRAARAASITFAEVEIDWAASTVSCSDTAATSAEKVESTLTLLRGGVAAIARGITRRAYTLARDYAEERRQGGVTIIEYDAVSDMLARIAVSLNCPPTLTAADPAEALALKIAACDAAVASTIDAVQVFGGTGYMHETGVEKLMRDAKYCQLFPEPNWVARDELVRLVDPSRP